MVLQLVIFQKRKMVSFFFHISHALQQWEFVRELLRFLDSIIRQNITLLLMGPVVISNYDVFRSTSKRQKSRYTLSKLKVLVMLFARF